MDRVAYCSVDPLLVSAFSQGSRRVVLSRAAGKLISGMRFGKNTRGLHFEMASAFNKPGGGGGGTEDSDCTFRSCLELASCFFLTYW